LLGGVAWATDALQRFDASVSALAHQLGVSWHTVCAGGLSSIWKSTDVHGPGLALARLLPLEADCEIQVDVFVRDKAVTKVPGKARVAGGVNAFRDRPPQQSVSVGGLDDVQWHPTTMARGETFYVRAEGGLVTFADRSAHGERDKGNGQGGPFAEGNRSSTPT
jgi:hypothetical protein